MPHNKVYGICENLCQVETLSKGQIENMVSEKQATFAGSGFESDIPSATPAIMTLTNSQSSGSTLSGNLGSSGSFTINTDMSNGIKFQTTEPSTLTNNYVYITPIAYEASSAQAQITDAEEAFNRLFGSTLQLQNTNSQLMIAAKNTTAGKVVFRNTFDLGASKLFKLKMAVNTGSESNANYKCYVSNDNTNFTELQPVGTAYEVTTPYRYIKVEVSSINSGAVKDVAIPNLYFDYILSTEPGYVHKFNVDNDFTTNPHIKVKMPDNFAPSSYINAYYINGYKVDKQVYPNQTYELTLGADGILYSSSESLNSAVIELDKYTQALVPHNVKFAIGISPDGELMAISIINHNVLYNSTNTNAQVMYFY